MPIVDKNSTNPTLDYLIIELAGKYSLSRLYDAGQDIFKEGEIGNTMLLVLRGMVEVVKRGNDESGSRRVIALRGPGDFLGEMVLVDETERFATVVAATECEVLEFSRANFERVISEQPAFASRVLRSLSRKLRESDSFRIAELEESNRVLNATNAELLHLNSFLDRVIDQSPSAIFVATRAGDVFRMNRAAAQIFDIAGVESVPRISKLICDFDNLCQQGADQNSWHGQATGMRGSDSFPIYLSISSLSGQSSDLLKLIICQDISELQLLNQTICEVERYESAKETAVEMAHDIKNYLGVLTGNAELILSRFTPDQRHNFSELTTLILLAALFAEHWIQDFIKGRWFSHARPERGYVSVYVRRMVSSLQS
ncbi:MAG: cyclic nucleotide-binding domain-containing protein [candidate division Zixibacteria bacterium]|nr:cyclic nucleotide-binding domain-containing protein [candidate division Zixibacteria bacterium]